jgi:hypothetical protein
VADSSAAISRLYATAAALKIAASRLVGPLLGIRGSYRPHGNLSRIGTDRIPRLAPRASESNIVRFACGAIRTLDGFNEYSAIEFLKRSL